MNLEEPDAHLVLACYTIISGVFALSEGAVEGGLAFEFSVTPACYYLFKQSIPPTSILDSSDMKSR